MTINVKTEVFAIFNLIKSIGLHEFIAGQHINEYHNQRGDTVFTCDNSATLADWEGRKIIKWKINVIYGLNNEVDICYAANTYSSTKTYIPTQFPDRPRVMSADYVHVCITPADFAQALQNIQLYFELWMQKIEEQRTVLQQKFMQRKILRQIKQIEKM